MDIDQAYIDRLFKIESGGDPNAVTGSNRGLGQFGPEDERQFGITDANRADPNAQSAAVVREAMQHQAILRSKLGRDPTPGELYLSHQQGVAGGPALLTADPSIPAWQAIRPYYHSDRIAKLAITGNIPSNDPLRGRDPDSISASDFRNLWVQKFERGIPGQVVGAAADQPSAAPASRSLTPMPAATPAGASVPPAAPVGMLNGAGMPAPQATPEPAQPDPNAGALGEAAKAMLAQQGAQQPQGPAPLQIDFPIPQAMKQRMLAALQTRLTQGAV